MGILVTRTSYTFNAPETKIVLMHPNVHSRYSFYLLRTLQRNSGMNLEIRKYYTSFASLDQGEKVGTI